jgi:hypothetical protein
MFNESKYTKWYLSITSRAQQRQLEGYIERHHIIPKSIGGSNAKSNIAVLTAREHFICHRLLVKMTNGPTKRKMMLALLKMCQVSGTHERYTPTSRTFELIRKQCSEAVKGSNNPNYGRKHSPEVRAKISAKVQASYERDGKRTMSEEAKQKIRKKAIGRKRPQHVIDAMVDGRRKSGGYDNNSGKRWFNDGTRSYLAKDCPEGCVLGRLPLSN